MNLEYCAINVYDGMIFSNFIYLHIFFLFILSPFVLNVFFWSFKCYIILACVLLKECEIQEMFIPCIVYWKFYNMQVHFQIFFGFFFWLDEKKKHIMN